MTKFDARQRGFTLIEMSIVLVIIGLIIGGILKGQELIESARQKNMISQIDSLKAATTTFVDRFKSLPGDYSQANVNIATALTSGNDNGYIGPVPFATAAGLLTLNNAIGQENEQYFAHLEAANMVGGGTPTAVATTCFSGNCATASPQPASAFPNSGLSLIYGTHDGVAANDGSQALAHWLVVSKWKATTITATSAADGVISGARLYQLDSKYDDGVASTGNIRTTGTGTGCGAAGTSYTPTVTDNNCIFAFNPGF